MNGRFFTVDIRDERVVQLLEGLGIAYSYGGGKPHDSDQWPNGVPGSNEGLGLDCSGWAQWALVKLGWLSPSMRDKGSLELSGEGVAVLTTDEAILGDLVFYAGPSGIVNHVMVSLGGGAVIGASGGTSVTNGDDRKAYVQIRPIDYRPVVAIRRF